MSDTAIDLVTQRNDTDDTEFEVSGNASDITDDLLEDESDDDSDIETLVESVQTKSKKNFLDISTAAESSVRFGVSSAATAAIINGILSDLIKAGHISPELSYLCCDTNKVFSTKHKVLTGATAEAEDRLGREEITGLFLDGRKDETVTIQREEETGNFHR